MGASHSDLQNEDLFKQFIREEWIKQMDLGMYELWQNIKTGELCEAYRLDYIPQEQELQHYRFRHYNQNADNFVEIRYVDVEKKQTLCSHGQSYVLTEFIPIKLSQIKDLTQIEAYSILRASYRAFHTMEAFHGPFIPDEDLIGINLNGKPKIWLNKDHSKNKADSVIKAQIWEKHMGEVSENVKKILEMVEQRLKEKQFPSEFRQFFYDNVMNFSQASEFVQEYCQKYRIIIPHAVGYSRFLQEPDVIKIVHQYNNKTKPTPSNDRFDTLVPVQQDYQYKQLTREESHKTLQRNGSHQSFTYHQNQFTPAHVNNVQSNIVYVPFNSAVPPPAYTAYQQSSSFQIVIPPKNIRPNFQNHLNTRVLNPNQTTFVQPQNALRNTISEIPFQTSRQNPRIVIDNKNMRTPMHVANQIIFVPPNRIATFQQPVRTEISQVQPIYQEYPQNSPHKQESIHEKMRELINEDNGMNLNQDQQDYSIQNKDPNQATYEAQQFQGYINNDSNYQNSQLQEQNNRTSEPDWQNPQNQKDLKQNNQVYQQQNNKFKKQQHHHEHHQSEISPIKQNTHRNIEEFQNHIALLAKYAHPHQYHQQEHQDTDREVMNSLQPKNLQLNQSNQNQSEPQDQKYVNSQPEDENYLNPNTVEEDQRNDQSNPHHQGHQLQSSQRMRHLSSKNTSINRGTHGESSGTMVIHQSRQNLYQDVNQEKLNQIMIRNIQQESQQSQNDQNLNDDNYRVHYPNGEEEYYEHPHAAQEQYYRNQSIQQYNQQYNYNSNENQQGEGEQYNQEQYHQQQYNRQEYDGEGRKMMDQDYEQRNRQIEQYERDAQQEQNHQQQGQNYEQNQINQQYQQTHNQQHQETQQQYQTQNHHYQNNEHQHNQQYEHQNQQIERQHHQSNNHHQQSSTQYQQPHIYHPSQLTEQQQTTTHPKPKNQYDNLHFRNESQQLYQYTPVQSVYRSESEKHYHFGALPRPKSTGIQELTQIQKHEDIENYIRNKYSKLIGKPQTQTENQPFDRKRSTKQYNRAMTFAKPSEQFQQNQVPTNQYNESQECFLNNQNLNQNQVQRIDSLYERIDYHANLDRRTSDVRQSNDVNDFLDVGNLQKSLDKKYKNLSDPKHVHMESPKHVHNIRGSQTMSQEDGMNVAALQQRLQKFQERQSIERQKSQRKLETYQEEVSSRHNNELNFNELDNIVEMMDKKIQESQKKQKESYKQLREQNVTEFSRKQNHLDPLDDVELQTSINNLNNKELSLKDIPILGKDQVSNGTSSIPPSKRDYANHYGFDSEDFATGRGSNSYDFNSMARNESYNTNKRSSRNYDKKYGVLSPVTEISKKYESYSSKNQQILSNYVPKIVPDSYTQTNEYSRKSSRRSTRNNEDAKRLADKISSKYDKYMTGETQNYEREKPFAKKSYYDSGASFESSKNPTAGYDNYSSKYNNKQTTTGYQASSKNIQRNRSSYLNTIEQLNGENNISPYREQEKLKNSTKISPVIPLQSNRQNSAIVSKESSRMGSKTNIGENKPGKSSRVSYDQLRDLLWK